MRGAGARPEEEHTNYSYLSLAAATRAHPFYLFLVCPVCPPRAFFPICYIIYFERVHLKNWLSHVRVLAVKWSLRAERGLCIANENNMVKWFHLNWRVIAGARNGAYSPGPLSALIYARYIAALAHLYAAYIFSALATSCLFGNYFWWCRDTHCTSLWHVRCFSSLI